MTTTSPSYGQSYGHAQLSLSEFLSPSEFGQRFQKAIRIFLWFPLAFSVPPFVFILVSTLWTGISRDVLGGKSESVPIAETRPSLPPECVPEGQLPEDLLQKINELHNPSTNKTPATTTSEKEDLVKLGTALRDDQCASRKAAASEQKPVPRVWIEEIDIDLTKGVCGIVTFKIRILKVRIPCFRALALIALIRASFETEGLAGSADKTKCYLVKVFNMPSDVVGCPSEDNKLIETAVYR